MEILDVMEGAIAEPRNEVSKYGVIDVDYEDGDMIYAKSIDEKPAEEEAKSNLAVVGRYILSHEIFDVLRDLEPGVNNEIQLTDAILQMIPTHGLVGFRFKGERFDCGSKEGLFAAILRVAKDDAKLQTIAEKFIK